MVIVDIRIILGVDHPQGYEEGLFQIVRISEAGDALDHGAENRVSPVAVVKPLSGLESQRLRS